MTFGLNKIMYSAIVYIEPHRFLKGINMYLAKFLIFPMVLPGNSSISCKVIQFTESI